VLAHNPKPAYTWLVPAFGGCVLIAMGGALAIDQLGYPLPYRWAFFILLLPAASAIWDSFRIARIAGWRSIQPLSRLIAGAVFGLVGVLLSLRLNTGLILPVLTVALGAATVVRAILSRLH
jgi:hypothetical protein